MALARLGHARPFVHPRIRTGRSDRGVDGGAGALVQLAGAHRRIALSVGRGSTALLCGFWQAVIVSLTAVVAQSWYSARHPELSLAANPQAHRAGVFVLVPSRQPASSRITEHAREAESRGGQMENLYEFTRRTLQMNLYIEPGPQLAELVHDIFDLEAVAVFDADLHDVYQAGYWNVDPQEMAQNVYYFETSDDDPASGIGRRVCAWVRCPSAAWWCAATPVR